MRKSLIVSLLLILCSFSCVQKPTLNFTEYIKPSSDTLFYNCVYDSFHASGIKETIALVYRSMRIGNDTAYYISAISDTTGETARLSSFTSSAMIFKSDTVYLASLNEGGKVSKLTRSDFTHCLSPNIKFQQPFELSKNKWAQYIDSTYIKNYQFEDLVIDDTVLPQCLRLNLLVYDRSSIPENSSVWLYAGLGIVKWLRYTGRTEVLDIRRSLNESR